MSSIKGQLNQYIQSNATRSEKVAENINDWQLIKQYLSSPVPSIELTENQQNKLLRYTTIYHELVGNKYDEPELISLIRNQYDISETQARVDIACTREIWSDTLSLNKLFEIKVSIERCKRLLRKAEDQNDMKAYAWIDKNLQRYLSMLPDQDTQLPQDFYIPELEPVYDPALLGARKIDLKELEHTINEMRSKKANSFIEDISIIPDNDNT